jgi:RNA-directed DNA polymerase
MISELVARDLGISSNYIGVLARSASHRYYSFKIPKKNGGQRDIHHPSRELKLVQRWIVKNVFELLPVHAAAYGYRKGLNIAHHAGIHSAQNFLLKLDFSNFFPSVRANDIVNILRRNAETLRKIITPEADYEMITRIVCRQGSLTIGAPSSPIISNVVMFDFDSDWAEWSKAEGVTYSRYADDLCFSTNKRDLLADLLQRLREDIARRNSPRLQLNPDKTVFTSRKRLRLVTGLVLTPTKGVSIGRERKRRVKSLVYRHSKGRLSKEEQASLQGLISYIQSVEPTFVDALRRKHGSDLMGSLGA